MGENEEQWGKDRWYDSSKVTRGPFIDSGFRSRVQGVGRKEMAELLLIPKENGAFPRQRTDAPTWPRPFHQCCQGRALPISD